MEPKVERVNGWEIHHLPSGEYGIQDDNGPVAGRFGSLAEASAAARRLPKPRQSRQTAEGSLVEALAPSGGLPAAKPLVVEPGPKGRLPTLK